MRARDISDELRRIMSPKLAKEFNGPSPGVFIGSEGYPNVNAGPLGSFDVANEQPSEWLKLGYDQIIAIRGNVIRSGTKQSVFSKERIIDNMKEISLASKPAEIEMIFQKKPTFAMNFDSYVQPMGPFAKLERLRITENPKIEQRVEKIVSDEIKANQMANMLYDYGLDVYKITTILSSGALGLDKKMVPTRWAITATDDILAKSLLKDIRTYKPVNEITVFESWNLDNHFIILVMPGSWEFENFECWSRGPWAGIQYEYEPFEGRTTYAEQEGGGYYASRIGIAEHLHNIRRQARVVVFREIYEGYTIPLGVWQVRENVRNAFSSEGRKFALVKEALLYIGKHLRTPLNQYLSKSRIFRQRRLTDY